MVGEGLTNELLSLMGVDGEQCLQERLAVVVDTGGRTRPLLIGTGPAHQDRRTRDERAGLSGAPAQRAVVAYQSLDSGRRRGTGEEIALCVLTTQSEDSRRLLSSLDTF